MKGLLARRRWHRWYHAIIAMNRYVHSIKCLSDMITKLLPLYPFIFPLEIQDPLKAKIELNNKVSLIRIHN